MNTITKEQDGIIDLDTEFAREIGFTSDKFSGYLWRKGEWVWISVIISKQAGQGNLSRLFAAIEDKGLKVAVPNPFPHMQRILTHKGFHETIQEDELFGFIDVWVKGDHCE